jgi:hypothetical protein
LFFPNWKMEEKKTLGNMLFNCIKIIAAGLHNAMKAL